MGRRMGKEMAWEGNRNPLARCRWITRAWSKVILLLYTEAVVEINDKMQPRWMRQASLTPLPVLPCLRSWTWGPGWRR